MSFADCDETAPADKGTDCNLRTLFLELILGIFHKFWKKLMNPFIFFWKTFMNTLLSSDQCGHLQYEKSKTEEKKKAKQHEATMLKKHNDESNTEISTLKQELEMAKKRHAQWYHELEAEAKLVKSDLEKRLKEQEQLLKDSKLKMRELEAISQSKTQNWSKKEQIYESFLNIQWAGLQVRF